MPNTVQVAARRQGFNVDASDVFWVLAFIFVLHKFDFVDAVRYDSRVQRLAQSDFGTAHLPGHSYMHP